MLISLIVLRLRNPCRQTSTSVVKTKRQNLKELVFKCGLSQAITFNSFRHRFVYDLLEKGLSLVRLSKLMGLEDIARVFIYIDFVREKRELV